MENRKVDRRAVKMKKVIRETFLSLLKEKKLNNAMYRLRKLFTEKVLFEEPEFYTSEFDRIESLFMVSGVMGVLEEWLTCGLEVPRHEISAMLHRILLKF